MYAINTSHYEAGRGFKNLNIRHKWPTEVGDWTSEVEFIPLETAPENMMCFSMEDWLRVVKPTLREGTQYYLDYK
jgi:hypothetical protein